LPLERDPGDQEAAVGSVDKEGAFLIDGDSGEFRDGADYRWMERAMMRFEFLSEIPKGDIGQGDDFCVCVVLGRQPLKLFDSFVEVAGDPLSLLALFA
jgi:hypothetical protein